MPDAVAARLLAHLGSGTLRPNKLRKLVCDAASGVSWTQFAQALEGLRTEGILETELRHYEDDGTRAPIAPFARARARARVRVASHIASGCSAHARLRNSNHLDCAPVR